jgi:glyoxylase-like metal-dependent hydrolase (beta-lactamase superfamily II)
MITEISPHLLSVLAPNPSPMTAAGTNSYVLKGARGAIVIDPGPDLPSHKAALVAAVADLPLRAILITHAHIDHTEIAPWLGAQMGAPILSFGGAHSGRRTELQGLTTGEGVDSSHQPDLVLSDGQVLHLAGHQITALHTPGHMAGHMCFAWEDVLFSGDHVMGWSSSVVAPPDGDMGDYRASLEKIAKGGWRQFLPGHGAVIDEPLARVQHLIAHRAQREAMILAALPPEGSTAQSIAIRIYTDTPAALMPAATQNVMAHLIDLANRKLVAPRAPVSSTVIFDRL